MHAYASTDPVFLAMNQRGQRETNGELGSFCVQCHAPMALRTGATTDGLNLKTLPEHLQGVTLFLPQRRSGQRHAQQPLSAGQRRRHARGPCRPGGKQRPFVRVFLVPRSNATRICCTLRFLSRRDYAHRTPHRTYFSRMAKLGLWPGRSGQVFCRVAIAT